MFTLDAITLDAARTVGKSMAEGTEWSPFWQALLAVHKILGPDYTQEEFQLAFDNWMKQHEWAVKQLEDNPLDYEPCEWCGGKWEIVDGIHLTQSHPSDCPFMHFEKPWFYWGM